MDRDQSDRYRWNLIASYAQQICTALNGIVAPSIAIRIWGQEAYGIWLLASTYIGYLYMLGGMGLDNAVFILMSREPERARKLRILRKAGSVLPVVSAAIAVLFIAAEYFGFHWLSQVGRMPHSLADLSTNLGRILMILFISNLPFTVAGGALSGIGKYYLRSIFDAASSLLGLIGVVFCAVTGQGLIAFGLYYGIFQIGLSLWRLKVVWKELSGNQSLGDSESVDLRKILAYGWASFAFGSIQILSQAVEIYFVGRVLELTLATEYMMLLRVQGMGFGVIAGMSNSLAPLLAEKKKSDVVKFDDLAKTVEKRVFALSCVAVMVYAAWMPKFFSVWTGKDVRLPLFLLILIGAQGIVSTRNNFLHVSLNSYGKIKDAMMGAMIELCIKILMMFAVYMVAKSTYVPLASIVAGTLVSLLFLQRKASSVLGWDCGLSKGYIFVWCILTASYLILILAVGPRFSVILPILLFVVLLIIHRFGSVGLLDGLVKKGGAF